MSKVLLTGASGFVGQHLLKALVAKGDTVRALYNRHAPSGEMAGLPGVEWVCCDLLDVYAVEEVMAGITEVYHCAAIVSFDRARKDELLHTNVTSTAHVVDCALEAGVRKLVYLSSVAALGEGLRGKEVTEEAIWEESYKGSTYGLSKYAAEMEVWRGIAEGLDAAILNPGIILGEGDWNYGTGKLLSIVAKEFPFYTEGITAWVDVQDVVRAAVGLMESAVTAERFILSAGNFGYRVVFSQMAAALGVKPPRYKANRIMTGLVWRFGALRKALVGGDGPTITRETARTARTVRNFSNAKLPQYLPGFVYTPFGETIRRLAAAYRSDAALPSNSRG